MCSANNSSTDWTGLFKFHAGDDDALVIRCIRMHTQCPSHTIYLLCLLYSIFCFVRSIHRSNPFFQWFLPASINKSENRCIPFYYAMRCDAMYACCIRMTQISNTRHIYLGCSIFYSVSCQTYEWLTMENQTIILWSHRFLYFEIKLFLKFI